MWLQQTADSSLARNDKIQICTYLGRSPASTSTTNDYRLTPFRPPPSKERLQQFRATACQNASAHFHLMIQLGVVHHFHHRMNRSCFRIVRTVNQAFQPRMNQSASAHRARFNCSKELAVSQAMVTEVCTGLAQGNDFGVRAGVGVGQVPIPSPPDNLASTDYDRPHRHFSRFERALGGAQSLLHPEFIGGSRGRWSLVIGRWPARQPLYRHTPSAILRLMVCYFVMGIPKLLRKVFLLDLLQGLKVTFRYQDPREIYTEQYPLQRPQVAERYRGAPRLNVNPDTNETMCIACDLCALACPEHLIVVTSARNETTRRKELTNFTYDLSRCMFCGLCEDACPVDALELTQDFELASYTREGAIWNREMLEKGPQPTQYRK